MSLHTYLPQDRRQAMANGIPLPDSTNGSALFADISGFVPLTEQLRHALGPRRGAEELTLHLNAAYTSLIATVERFGGSVISFAGDGITCWFDEAQGESALRAVACGVALQSAIRPFSTPTNSHPSGQTQPQPITLALKVAVTSGAARRFVVGDPDYLHIDTIAGATVTHLALGQQLANKGEVLIDEATARVLDTAVIISQWRTNTNSPDRFGVVDQLRPTVTTTPPAKPSPLDPSLLQPWLHRPVYEQEVAGQASFLAEFRPCAALFLLFAGIDYDAATAESQLDAFTRQIQAIAARYDGTLLHLIIGDKGNYACLNFGALSAHEDDPKRAVKAALALREAAAAWPWLTGLQMGISYGLMWVGAYGASSRRTYSALGDQVNLAARLMQTAVSGQILVSQAIKTAVSSQYTFAPHPTLYVKGKSDPLHLFLLTGTRQHSLRLQEPSYALPMIGRQTEIQLIQDKLALVQQGQAQVIGIVAEAGLGKSRLVAEIVGLARQQGFVAYGGACQSDGIHTPYLTWKSIWSAFFAIDPDQPWSEQQHRLTEQLEAHAPARLAALPLLAPLLNLSLPENEFTQALDPKSRQSALHALLEDCLKTAVSAAPILIVIEDLHWIDALAHELLDQLARALAHYPICFLLAYRPPQLERLQAPRLTQLPNFTKIKLTELDDAEAQQLIQAKLNQLYPNRGGAVSPQLIQQLMERTQGNPFYLEELLNFWRDQQVDPRDPVSLGKMALPDSLHSLILSRIDRLSSQERHTLRVASVIGRLFSIYWLIGYYPELGPLAKLRPTLNKLHKLDITPLDTPEPELAYLFKHIVTHEVTYESLPFTTRARLHEQLAHYLEATYPDALPIEALAFHYSHSHNQSQKRYYIGRAAEVAQASYANDAAISYYTQLLPLLDETADQMATLQQRGTVLELTGAWAEAEADYEAALALAQTTADKAYAQFTLGRLYRKRSQHDLASQWLNKAQANDPDPLLASQILIEMGLVYYRQGEYKAAQTQLEAGLDAARQADQKDLMALSLNGLGNLAYEQSDYATAHAIHEQSLALRRAIHDKRGVSASLNNLGIVAADQGDYERARTYYEESLALKREFGDKWGIATSLNNLGVVAFQQADFETAQTFHEGSLALCREMGDQLGIADAIANLGTTAACQADYATAYTLHNGNLARYVEMGDKQGQTITYFMLGYVALAQKQYEAGLSHYQASLILATETNNKLYIAYNLAGLAATFLADGSDKVACQQATRLAAAAATLLTKINGRMEPFINQQYETCVATLKEILDIEFDENWTAGSSLPLETLLTADEYGKPVG